MKHAEQSQRKSPEFNLIQIPQVITREEARELIQFHKTHPHLLKDDTSPLYHKRKIPIEHIKTNWIRTLVRKLEYLAISEIAMRTGEKVFPEQSEIMCFPNGTEIPKHIDVYDDSEGNTIHPNTTWSAVVYLNNGNQGGAPMHYNGGHLIFEPCEQLPMGLSYNPEICEMVLFQGMDFHHSVSKVYRGDRYTLPMWFTTNILDIRPESPIL